jgi:hypothetical protein
MALRPVQAPALDRHLLERVLRSHLSEVRACYELALHRDPQLTGRLQVRFVLSPLGEVTAAVAASDTLGDPALQRCVLDRFLSWKFPAFRVEAEVTLPLVLQPES